MRVSNLTRQHLFSGYEKREMKFELVLEQVLKLSGAHLDYVLSTGSVVKKLGPKALLEKNP